MMPDLDQKREKETKESVQSAHFDDDDDDDGGGIGGIRKRNQSRRFYVPIPQSKLLSFSILTSCSR